MDIVVYIKGGENESLRYAIRTWCENLAFDKLCVVGGPKPTWLNPDIYIENVRNLSKMFQSYSNVYQAMKDERLSQDVLLLMDDVFILSPTTWTINYNRGTLAEHYERSVHRFGPNGYADQLKATEQIIGTKDCLSFEEHAPFLCNREKMLSVLSSLNKEQIPNALYRSIYGNKYHIPTEFKLDVKLTTGGEKFANTDFVISTSVTSFNGATGRIIKSWFPDKSRFEN